MSRRMWCNALCCTPCAGVEGADVVFLDDDQGWSVWSIDVERRTNGESLDESFV